MEVNPFNGIERGAVKGSSLRELPAHRIHSMELKDFSLGAGVVAVKGKFESIQWN